MIVEDRVYGRIKIDEPLVLELLGLPEFQRLAYINQLGLFQIYVPGSFHSRLEHSVGVYWLLKLHNASFEEQIAGLLHDVSHSAFSHCIDYVLKGGSHEKHDFQDRIMASYVRKSAIPEVLSRFDIELDSVLDDERHPLKERELPDLCADRIDYCLRGALALSIKTTVEANSLLSELKSRDGKWYFSKREHAQSFYDLFENINDDYYASFKVAAMFRTLGECLRYALQKGYLEENDLFTYDELVLKKIEAHLSDNELNTKYRRMMDPNACIETMEDEGEPITLKSRAVDPLYLAGAGLQQLSSSDNVLAQKVQDGLAARTYRVKLSY